jgi:hypothetical protein
MEIASELLPCVNMDGKPRMHSDYNAQVLNQRHRLQQPTPSPQWQSPLEQGF